MNHNKLKPPIGKVLTQGDIRKKCEVCGSSMRRKLWMLPLGCKNPKCENYYEK